MLLVIYLQRSELLARPRAQTSRARTWLDGVASGRANSQVRYIQTRISSNIPNHIRPTHPSKTTPTNLLSAPLGLPLVRHPPDPPIPPPHPPTPRHPRPNLEHRILQRTPLALSTHLLGENPAIPHSRLRRRPAALPPRAVAQSLRRPSQPLAAECDCRGGRSVVFDAVGG